MAKALTPIQPPFTGDIVWTLAEAAHHMRVSQTWLRKSNCPYVRFGVRRLYDPDECRKFVKANLSHHVGSAA